MELIHFHDLGLTDNTTTFIQKHLRHNALFNVANARAAIKEATPITPIFLSKCPLMMLRGAMPFDCPHT